MWVAMSSYNSACRTATSAWSRARNPTLPTRSIGRSYPARPPPKIGLMLTLATRAPIWLHPADRELWDQAYPDRAPDRDLADGQRISVAGAELTVLHTPGHSRGAVC